MVIDTSALLAVFFEEPHENWVRQQLKEQEPFLYMSTVNLAEFLILILERRPATYSEIRKRLYSSSISFIPPTAFVAELSAQARKQYCALNFGDCFAYALAKEMNQPVLTLDSDFKKTDIEIITASSKTA